MIWAAALLFALLAGLAGLLCFHASMRGPDLAWKYYDPTFLYAVPDSPEALMREACDEQTIFALGSSVLLAAFDQLPPRPEGRWTVTTAPAGARHQLRILTRYGSTDLRLFQPLLRRLPACPKTLLLHSDVFVERDFKPAAPGDYLYTFAERLRDRAERLWPRALRRRMRESRMREVGPCDAACLENRRDAMGRRFGTFSGIPPEHLEIVRELVAGGARVIVLDVGRSELLEAEFEDDLARFRAAVAALGDRLEVEVLAFPPQDDALYADYTHLNEAGRSAFARWLAGTRSLPGEAP